MFRFAQHDIAVIRRRCTARPKRRVRLPARSPLPVAALTCTSRASRLIRGLTRTQFVGRVCETPFSFNRRQAQAPYKLCEL